MEDLKKKLRRLAGQCRLNLSRMSFRKNLQIDILTIWQQAGYSVARSEGLAAITYRRRCRKHAGKQHKPEGHGTA